MSLRFSGQIDGETQRLILQVWDESAGAPSETYSMVIIDLDALIAKSGSAGAVLNVGWVESDMDSGYKAMVCRSQYYGA